MLREHKNKNVFTFLLFFSMTLLLVFDTKTVSAMQDLSKNAAFVLNPTPTVNQEVVYTAASTAQVTNDIEFRTAYTNNAISRIVLLNDITLSNANYLTISAHALSRSLQIDGAGFNLILATTTSGDRVFNISTTVTEPLTLHLKDLNLSKLDWNGQHQLIIGGNSRVDVIFDNFTNNSGVFFRRYWGHANGSRLFFRNNNTMTRINGEFTYDVMNVIYEKNSKSIISDATTGNIGVSFFWDSIDGRVSNIFIDGEVELTRNSTAYSVFYRFENIIIGSSGSLKMIVNNLTTNWGAIDAYLASFQKWQVDSGGSLNVESTSGAPVIRDNGYVFTLETNPGANVELTANTSLAVILVSNLNSKFTFDTPNVFNIINRSFDANLANSRLVNANVNSKINTVEIINTDLGLWARGTNLAGLATVPSPFKQINLNFIDTVAIAGSSPIIETMPGGFNINKYQRISKVPIPTFTPSDLSLSLNKTKPIEIVDVKFTDTFTYSTADSSIAVVDAAGLVTGKAVGTTTLLITATNTLGGSSTKTINITVTNHIPSITLDAFTEVALNGSFNPKTGVSASDITDGDLTADIIITGSVDTAVAGIYPITYSVTNSVGNTKTKTRVVLVNDGSYVAGNNYIIQAKDFTIRVSQVNVADSAIIAKAQAVVYDKVDGMLVSNAVTVSDTGGYKNVVGTYPIQFIVTNEPLTIKKINATVEAGSKPVITITNSFVELGLNDTYDIFTGVSATDAEDGPLSASSITSNITLDTSVENLTLVTYTATDADGNSVTATRTILVNNGSYVAGTNFVLYAKDFSIRKSLVSRTEGSIIAATQAVAYDKVTALPVANRVKVKDFTTYAQILGAHDIILEVVADPAVKTIKANVITGDLPILITPAFTEIQVNDTFDTRLNVSANDTEDGVISDKINVSSYLDTAVAGVYRVEYTISDSDHNTVVGHQVVLVNDGTYAYGDNYIIGAVDFLRGLGQVDTSDAALKDIANLSVYDKVSGYTSTTPITINKGGYSAVIGLYNIAFTVAADLTTFKTVVGEVSALNAPEIIYAPFTEIAVGDTFDKSNNFSASDLEDGDLTNDAKTTIQSNVDTSKPGVYTVKYTVEDSDLNVIHKTQIVLVNDGNYTAGSEYIIYAIPFTKRISEVDTAKAAIKEAGLVKTYSMKTGLPVNTVNILITNDGGYKVMTGLYDITLAVEIDPSAKITIVATVTNGDKPVLVIPAFTEIATGTIFDKKANVSANDTEDGDLTNSISAVGIVDINTEGVYTVDYEVEDLDGNIIKATQVVLVTDGSFVAGADYIIGAQGFTRRVSEVDNSKSGIISAAAVLLYNKVSGQPITNYKTSDFTVVDGGYTGVVKTYDIKIAHAVDTAANIVVKGDVIAGQKPTITLPTPSPTVVAKGATFDVLNGVTASDVEDGDLTPSISVDIASIDTSTFGIYKLTYEVIDKDGNVDTMTRTVIVDDGNIVVGSDYLLYAKDFTLRAGEVVVLNDVIVNLAQVAVYDLVTADLITNGGVVSDFGGYATVASTYNIEYAVSAEPGLNITKKAVVTTGAAPVLVGLDFMEISIDTPFDANSAVTATDTEDNSNTLVVNLESGTIDTTIAGVYKLSYSVTDSDFNTTYGTKVVLVNDGTYVAGKDVIIKAVPFTVGVGQVNLDETIVKNKASVIAYSVADSSVVTDPIITDTMSYKASVGEYDISFTSKVDSSATITIVASVIARSLPELTVTPFFEINVNDIIDLKSGLVAIDTEDGDITDNIVIDDSLLKTNVAGLYPITYTVTDSDKNTVTLSSVVLVNDGTFVAGDNYVIQAKDFTKMVSEVDTDPNVIKTNGSVMVYDKLTSFVANVPVSVTDNGNYTNKAGNYNIIFTVDADELATKTIVATVDAGDMPVLKYVTPLVIPINSTFIPLDNVSATDKEDGVISVINFVSKVESNKAGVYTVDYSVIDRDLNKVSERQVVVVDDGSFNVGSAYAIQAYDFTKRVGQVIVEGTSDPVLFTLGKVNVYDLISGSKLNDAAQIDNNGGYSSVVNDYAISYSVIDEPTTKISVTASVISGFKPQLIVPSITEIPLNKVFNEMDGVSVSDVEDVLTIDDVTISNGTVNTTKAGVYTLKYLVTDSDNNVTTATRVIVVNDGSYVVGKDYIIHALSFTLGRGQVSLNATDIKEDASMVVYDITTGLPVNTNVSVNAPGYKNITGNYDISFTVSGDGVSISVLASVVNRDVPILNVRPFVEINVDDTFNVMDSISGTDKEDGTITNNIISAPKTIDTSVAGVYQIEYTVEDSDFNIITKYQTVLVNDGSYVAGDNYIITAHDFSKRVGQVNTDLNIIQSNAGVKIYDKVSAQEVVAPLGISYINGNNYAAIVRAYDIVFTVNNDSKASKSIVATVTDGLEPVLTVDTPTVIAVNDNLGIMTGVSATDNEDGDITSQVKPSKTVFNSSKAGVYTIKYSIVDSDKNTVVATRVVIVDDGSFAIGKDYAIQAYDYSAFTSEIINGGLTDSGIIQSAQARVFDLLTGKELVNDTVIDDKGGLSSVPNSYDITFSVLKDPTITKMIVASVISGEAPQIKGVDLLEINLNDSFDYLKGVSVVDKEDITIDNSDIIITGQVNTSVAGVYPIQYTVTDADNNTVSKTRIVVVNDGSYVVGTDYIIRAYNYTIGKGQVVLQNADIIKKADVKVFDINTGLVVNTPVSVNYGSYKQSVGTYNITFTVDADGSSIKVAAKVIDGELPTIDVRPFIEINVNDSFDILDTLSAQDVEDGALTNEVKTDVNTIDTSVAGVYAVHYTVIDSDLNEVSAIQVILVNDGSFVAGTNYIIRAQDFTRRISQVNKDLFVVDNDAQVTVYSVANGELVNIPVEIVNNGGYTNLVGTYDINFAVKNDAKANTTIVATVITGDTPTLNVPEKISEVKINTTFNVLGGISASDTEDGDITKYVQVSRGNLNTTIAGVYKLTYKITDKDGNSVSDTRIVVVNDGTFVIGSKYIIKASDYTIYSGKVIVDPTEILSKANYKLYDVTTGLPTASAIDVSYGAYSSAVNDYPITIDVIEDNTSIKINAHVIGGEIPVFSAKPFEEVKLNTSFNILSNVVVNDKEDGVIDPSKFIVTGYVDTSIAGLYPLTYTVTDADFNTVSYSKVVLVNDGTYVVGKDYVITAQDYTLGFGQVNLDSNAILASSKTRVYDKVTGLEVNNSVSVNPGNYQAKLGTYEIVLTVDADGTKAIINVNVVTGDIPTLQVRPFFEINVGDTIDLNETLIANDSEDGDLINVVDVNPGLLDVNVAGVYLVEYTVIDSDSNEVKASQSVLVNDGTYVAGDKYIIHALDYTIYVGSVNADDTIVKKESSLTVFDKFNVQPANVPVKVKSNGGYSKTPGEYQITLVVDQDSKAITTINATVITGDAPVFNETDKFIELPVTQKTAGLASFVSNDLMDGIAALDTEEGDVSGDIKVITNLDYTVPGVYLVTYTVTDRDLNTAEFKRTYLINDGSFKVGSTHIIYSKDFTINKNDVKDTASELIKMADVHVYSIETSYELFDATIVVDDGGYTATVGVYNVTYGTSADDTATSISKSNVISTDVPPVIITPKPNLPKTGQDSIILLVLISALVVAGTSYYKRRIV